MNVDFGKLYLIGEDGVPHVISEIKEVVEAEPDDVMIFKPNDGAFNNAVETLFGGWDAIEEVIDETLDINEKSPSKDLMAVAKLAKEGLTMAVHEEESPFIKEIQNQHKKYLRDKAQYKFWKDQEFIGNNRAGRRRRK